MHQQPFSNRRDAVARLRYAIIGPLLVRPPGPGELRARLDELAGTIWQHPVQGSPIRFGLSTIERWYYNALRAQSDPMGALRQRIRADRGRVRSVGPALAALIRELHKSHFDFSYTLFFDNLEASIKSKPIGEPLPSPSTIRRWMQSQGIFKKRRKGPKKATPGSIRATERFEKLEVRSYEVEHVHALWHLDFHVGSRKVLLRSGCFATAHLFATLDDHSRLCCHVQWYLAESAETLVHGLIQAILKRGVPRSLMFDNGSAMRAAETEEGLHAIGITPMRTLEYSPYQNGKQESFWNNIEGRLLPMISQQANVGLEELNELTQAWVESDYNRREHSELGTSPLARSLESNSVGRPSPTAEVLRAVFRVVAKRRQRRSDGTLTLEGRRFEVPSRYRHMRDLHVRYARWDLSNVDLWDPVQRVGLGRILPLDKAANADGVRRTRGPIAVDGVANMAQDESADAAPTDAAGESKAASWRVAPYLQALLNEMRGRGLPPAYLPTPEPGDVGASEGRSSDRNDKRDANGESQEDNRS